MKKILFSGLILISLAFGLGATGLDDSVQAEIGEDFLSESFTDSVFIPLISRSGGLNISGRVTDPQGNPVEEVTIYDHNGNQAETDQNGEYLLKGLDPGNYALAPMKDGLLFAPTFKEVQLTSSNSTQDFQALAACNNVITNGGFETDEAWQLPVTEYTAAYSTAAAHSGSRSVRTGITIPADNRYSYSSARQMVTIPSDSTSATLRVWLYPISDEVLTKANLQKGIQPLADRPIEPEFGTEFMAGDVQYVLVLDPGPNPEDPVDDKLIETLLWMRSDAQQWQFYTFDLLKYAGETIKIQVGTYNDGFSGASAMYADDIALEACDDVIPAPTPTPTASPSPTPPPGTCTELYANNSFETDSDWGIPITVYTAGYTTNQAHTGSRSMRTGIEFLGHNRFSYSDAYQVAGIPVSSTSATLEMYIYPVSGEATTLSLAEKPTAELLANQSSGGDVQYVLLLDWYGNWIDTFLWQRQNTQTWGLHQFDLGSYIGDIVRVQFGTYNDGWGGITTMYVDDTTLQACP
jgi:hypothetical protein